MCIEEIAWRRFAFCCHDFGIRDGKTTTRHDRESNWMNAVLYDMRLLLEKWSKEKRDKYIIILNKVRKIHKIKLLHHLFIIKCDDRDNYIRTHSHNIYIHRNRKFDVLVFQSINAVEWLMNIYSCRFSKKKRARIKLGGNRWNLVGIQYTLAAPGIRRG